MKRTYEKTIETKRTWFYSRSRRSLWNKGETSGNVQHVQSLYLDCDQDSIVVVVKASRACMSYGRKNMFSLQNYMGDTYEKRLYITIRNN